MNKKLLLAYIAEYKKAFSEIHQKEIYKWQSVKQFQDHWDIDAPDFHAMLVRSLSKSNNLLSSGKYYPKQMLIENAEKSPQVIRELFVYLFEEDFDLLERIAFFQDEFKRINRVNLPNSKSTYQDHRALLVYLSLRFPERYYLYKYKMFQQVVKKLEYDYIPVSGKEQNIGQFNTMCNLIQYEINADQELLKLHQERITDDCYYDKNSHLLTQDFVYAVARYLNVGGMPETGPFKVIDHDKISIEELNIDMQRPALEAKMINHLENAIENKRVGDLGEQWALNYEKKMLIEAGRKDLAGKIRHISSEMGDGAGFDIESFYKDGNPKYIEVKTTTGCFEQTFYITRNELEKSRLEKERYALYRIYNFREATNSADIKIITGDLTPLCTAPALYKVAIRQKK